MGAPLSQQRLPMCFAVRQQRGPFCASVRRARSASALSALFSSQLSCASAHRHPGLRRAASMTLSGRPSR
eukprot:IDg10355t1